VKVFLSIWFDEHKYYKTQLRCLDFNNEMKDKRDILCNSGVKNMTTSEIFESIYICPILLIDCLWLVSGCSPKGNKLILITVINVNAVYKYTMMY